MTDARSPRPSPRAWERPTPRSRCRRPALLVGTIDQMVEELQARRERWQMSYVVVPEEYADEFAPVVAALAGT